MAAHDWQTTGSPACMLPGDKRVLNLTDTMFVSARRNHLLLLELAAEIRESNQRLSYLNAANNLIVSTDS